MLEGASKPWAPTHMETVLSYLVQLLGLWCPLAWSACPPDCTVHASSLPTRFCRGTPGDKPNSCPHQELTSSLLSSWRGTGPPSVMTSSSHLSAGTSPLSTTQSSRLLFSPPEHHRPSPTPVAALCLPGQQPRWPPSGTLCPRADLLASSVVFLVCVGQYNF